MRRSSRIAAIYLPVLIVVLVAALILMSNRKNQPGENALSQLPVSNRLGGDFILPSTMGKPLDLYSLRGKVVLLTFGYAGCTEICPLGLMRLHEVIKSLGTEAANLQVVFVAFDSAQDLTYLARYIHKFDAAIIGVAGSDDEISDLTKRYGVVYPKQQTGTSKPTFDHNGYIYLIDQQGQVRALYQNNASVKDIVKDVRLLQETEGQIGQR